MLLHQTPDGVAVIEHDGALWQPTGDAETPDLQFTSDLAEYGWQPYAGTRDGLTVVAERQPGRRLPRLLATPEDLSEAAWAILRAPATARQRVHRRGRAVRARPRRHRVPPDRTARPLRQAEPHRLPACPRRTPGPHLGGRQSGARGTHAQPREGRAPARRPPP